MRLARIEPFLSDQVAITRVQRPQISAQAKRVKLPRGVPKKLLACCWRQFLGLLKQISVVLKCCLGFVFCFCCLFVLIPTKRGSSNLRSPRVTPVTGETQRAPNLPQMRTLWVNPARIHPRVSSFFQRQMLRRNPCQMLFFPPLKVGPLRIGTVFHTNLKLTVCRSSGSCARDEVPRQLKEGIHILVAKPAIRFLSFLAF